MDIGRIRSSLLAFLLALCLTAGMLMTSGVGYVKASAETTDAAEDNKEAVDTVKEDKAEEATEVIEDEDTPLALDDDVRRDTSDKKEDTDKAEADKADDEVDDADVADDADEEDSDVEEDVTEKEVVDSTESAADMDADVEAPADWEKTLPKKLAHESGYPEEADYRADIVAIANSQIGYKESAKNYVEYSDGTKAFYNRYGAWYADSYSDPWDAEFACFVLYYAGVPVVPYDGDTASWTSELSDQEMYFAPDYDAEAGDLVFLQEEDDTFHVGIITEAGDNKLTVVAGTVGKKRDKVKEFRISRKSDRIFAYGVVVPRDETDEIDETEMITETEPAQEEDTEAAVDETTEAKEDVAPAADEATEAKEDAAEESKITKSTVKAVVYTDDSKKTKLNDVAISVAGDLPVDSTITAYPVNASVDGEETYAAYQIVILDKKGNEYHSKSSDGRAITVTINDPALTKALKTVSDAHGWHKDDKNVSTISFNLLKDGGVQFVADEF